MASYRLQVLEISAVSHWIVARTAKTNPTAATKQDFLVPNHDFRLP